jgi:hypothetical protein
MGTDLEIAWFFGLGGVLIGAPVGFALGRGRVAVIASILVAVGAGVAVGIGVDVIVVHDVFSSDRSTAALGLLLLPFPPILNAVGAVLSALTVRAFACRPPEVPSATKFDLATGRPILGYDPDTGKPVLGDRAE